MATVLQTRQMHCAHASAWQPLKAEHAPRRVPNLESKRTHDEDDLQSMPASLEWVMSGMACVDRWRTAAHITYHRLGSRS